MKRRLMIAALVCGAAALLALAVSQARADDPAPFAPLPAGPGPAALTVGGPADGAAPLPKGAAPPSAAAPGAPPAAKVVVPPAPAHVPAEVCAPACEAPCLKKVCVPEQATRTVEKRVYGDVCEDFCVPKCTFGGGFGGFLHHKHDDCGACGPDGCGHGGCEDGNCAECGKHIRVRKFLVVKIRPHEECYTKCNVAYEAPCAHGACEAPAGCAGAVVAPPAPTPPVEKVPPPKEKK